MTESIVARIWDRIIPPEIVGIAAIAAVFYGFGHVETALALFVGVVIGVPIVGAVFDRIGFGRTSAGIAFGSIATVAGALSVLDDGSGSWFGAVLLTAGAWIVLDTLSEYRHSEPTDSVPAEGEEDVSMTEMQALGIHGRWVLETLREADRPLTADEIRSRTGLTSEEFGDVVEILEDNGTVEPVGNGYVIDESAMGVTGFVRSAGRRFLRPVRLFRPS